MKPLMNHKKRNKGQTALEYALVIGVISVGVIFAGKAVFGKGGVGSEQLMQHAIDSAEKTFKNEQN